MPLSPERLGRPWSLAVNAATTPTFALSNRPSWRWRMCATVHSAKYLRASDDRGCFDHMEARTGRGLREAAQTDKSSSSYLVT